MGRRRKNDSRNPLFLHFFRLVAETRPIFFVAENVPGILAPKYEELRCTAVKLVSEHYDVIGPFTLCASNFGAATIRTRVFFVGILKTCRKKLKAEDINKSQRIRKTSVRRALTGLPQNVRSNWQSEKSSWRQIEESNSRFFIAVNRFCEGVGDNAAVQRFVENLEVSGFLGRNMIEP